MHEIKHVGELLMNESCSIVRICYRPRLVERALHQKVLLYCIAALYSFVLQIINQKCRGLVHESIKSCDRLVWRNILCVILTTFNNTRQCFYQSKTVDSF